MEETRIAVVGAGLIGLRHMEALGQARGARLAAVIDPAPAAKDRAQSLGLPWFASVADMPPDTVDGVILATPNQIHVEGGLACVAQGLPVLVEKPFATSVEEAMVLLQAAEAAGVPLLTGHHRRYNPLIAAAKSLVTEGRIGRPVSVNGMFWLAKPDDYFDVAWRRQPGAGPVLVNLIHDIDLMRHLVGEVAAVQAVESRAVRGNAVEDACVIILEFENGALGTMNVADCIPAPWSWELTSGENPAYPQTDQACYVIGGTEGALELPRVRLWRHEGKRSWWEPLSATTAPRPSGDPLVLQAEHFARVIQAQEPPLVSGREGTRTLQVIEAVKASARDRQRITIETL